MTPERAHFGMEIQADYSLCAPPASHENVTYHATIADLTRGLYKLKISGSSGNSYLVASAQITSIYLHLPRSGGQMLTFRSATSESLQESATPPTFLNAGDDACGTPRPFLQAKSTKTELDAIDCGAVALS